MCWVRVGSRKPQQVVLSVLEICQEALQHGRGCNCDGLYRRNGSCLV